MWSYWELILTDHKLQWMKPHNCTVSSVWDGGSRCKALYNCQYTVVFIGIVKYWYIYFNVNLSAISLLPYFQLMFEGCQE